MRRGYTLIEIIITVAITAILAIGMFKALEAITIRSEKAKLLTAFSIDSQSALDVLSTLLYERAPMSLKGCTTNSDCVVMEETTTGKTILQWYGTASEAYKAGAYSGFVDMARSINPSLYTPDTVKADLENNQSAKWGSFTAPQIALSFAGAFETGESAEPYPVSIPADNQITFTGTVPSAIYEKYYLVDSAYAVTRKENAPSCGGKTDGYKNGDLLLFSNYRPWNGDTLCNGDVSLLDTRVSAFGAHILNGTLRLGIEKNYILKGSPNPIRLSKQKVVF
ncbi:MAG: prepilin-type N-terminal cleavage/methylation domain-containing protein [Sulfuricurvum sp.]